jgi:hypothetical protein
MESHLFPKSKEKFLNYLFIPTSLFSVMYLKLLKVRVKIMKAIFYPNYFVGYNKSSVLTISVLLV